MIGRSDPAQDPAVPQPREAVQRWRLVLGREAGDAALVQRALLTAWEEAFARSGLPVTGLDGTPPRARFAVGAPLAAAVEGEAELVDMTLVERLPRWRVREALEPVLPAGHRLVDLEDVWLGEPALPGQVIASVYRAELLEAVDPAAVPRIAGAVRALLAAPELPRQRRKGEGTVGYDLRPFVDALDLDAGPPAVLRMTLRHDPERGLGRPDEVLAELGDRLGSSPSARIVRERLVLAPERGRADRPERPARPPGRAQPVTATDRRGRK